LRRIRREPFLFAKTNPWQISGSVAFALVFPSAYEVGTRSATHSTAIVQLRALINASSTSGSAIRLKKCVAGIVLEAATDVDSLKHFIVAFARSTHVVGS
jgi:hypothetical protein